jgi:hypothetical protein
MPVADDKMTVNILAAGSVTRQVQLFDALTGAARYCIVGIGVAIVDFDPLPVSLVLGGPGLNGFRDRSQAVIP